MRHMTAFTVYLASASPRRKAILDQLGIGCEILPQHIDETRLPGENPGSWVCRLAENKAEKALGSVPSTSDAVILGADTTVVLGEEVFEKPADRQDAHRILSALSGRTHHVLTAVALAAAGNTQVLLSDSQVTFRTMSEREISCYWDTGEPADKAGAYGIQGLGALFIREIKGSYSGIMGLPVMETATLLATVGITSEKILERLS